MRLALLALVLSSFSVSIFTQSQTPPRRSVRVNVTGGSSITGKLIQADNEAVYIETELKPRMMIRTDEVTSIVFTDIKVSAANNRATIATQKAEPAQALLGAKEAVKALRSMQAATDVGINLRDYRNRLIEVKIIVDNAMSKLPEGDLKKELAAALQEYQFAIAPWESSIKYPDPEIKRLSTELMNSSWSKAKKHINNAARFTDQ